MTRERRTALAELQVATARMQTIKAALKEDPDTREGDAAILTMMATAAECIDRAMAALKS